MQQVKKELGDTRAEKDRLIQEKPGMDKPLGPAIEPKDEEHYEKMRKPGPKVHCHACGIIAVTCGILGRRLPRAYN